MAAKLLHTLADDNSELQKKFGCMNGIFKIFDRQHILTNRRKSLTLGNAHVNFDKDSTIEKQLTKVSTESSRYSFSSSCSSSSPLSSPINNKESQPTMSRGTTHIGLDLRDVVRDSMYRESPRPSFNGLIHSRPVDFDESCKALAKLRKTPQFYYNTVDTKDANRYYVDSRNKLKPTKTKVKDPPRLSLDSRDRIDLKGGSNISKVVTDSLSRSVSTKRPPSVVAKLMGLDTLPNSPLGKQRLNMFDDKSDAFSRSLRENSFNRNNRFSTSSPRSLGPDLASCSSSSSPRWRSSEFVMKPLSSLRYPIEPAPWKQTDRNHRFSHIQRPVRALKDPGKNLRALNEVLEVMQSSEGRIFDTQKQPQCSNLEPQSQRSLEKEVITPPTMRGPIVIMKPRRLVEKSGIPPSSLIPIHSLSSLNTTVKRNSTSRKACKDRSCRNQGAESGNRNVRSSSSQSSKESTSGGSVSPRLDQLKKHENDKTSSTASRKSRRHINRQTEESTTTTTYPGGRRSSRTKASQRTETEAIVTVEQATEAKTPSVIEAAKTVVSNLIKNKSSEDGSSEHPSPVSVLNSSIYREIKPSPLTIQAIESSTGLIDSFDEEWNPAYSFSETTTTTTGFSLEMNRKKLQNVNHLVQKLKRLNSTHDESSQDYIASLCDNNDPNTDHRYISEILLASGLLLRDLTSDRITFQLHPSGHPINPELFLVLEQTKGSSTSINEKLNRKLVFDAVNEILIKKLPFLQGNVDPLKKQTKRVVSAQQLLKDLCCEIETVQKNAKRRSDKSLLLEEEEEEEDYLKCILDEDLEIRSGKWIDFDDVIPSLVLDLERLLFKDLVSEIVHSEIAHLKSARF